MELAEIRNKFDGDAYHYMFPTEKEDYVVFEKPITVEITVPGRPSTLTRTISIVTKYGLIYDKQIINKFTYISLYGGLRIKTDLGINYQEPSLHAWSDIKLYEWALAVKQAMESDTGYQEFSSDTLDI